MYTCKESEQSLQSTDDRGLHISSIAVQETGLFEKMRLAMDDANNAQAREGAAILYSALCDQVGHACEPQLVQLLFSLLVLQGDKVVPVKMVAEGAGRALLSALCPHGIRTILQSE